MVFLKPQWLGNNIWERLLYKLIQTSFLKPRQRPKSTVKFLMHRKNYLTLVLLTNFIVCLQSRNYIPEILYLVDIIFQRYNHTHKEGLKSSKSTTPTVECMRICERHNSMNLLFYGKFCGFELGLDCLV